MTGKPGTVYVLVDPRGDTVRYVGQTTRPLSQRLSGHLSSRGTPVAEWVTELRNLGLRPQIRPVVENVANANLIDVETAQIRAHFDAGWPLLNAEARNRSADVAVARRRVAKCRTIGGVLLAEAEAQLEVAAERHVWDLEQRAAHVDRMRTLYPEDAALQPWAVMRYVRAEGNTHLLTPEGWEHFTEVIVDLASTLKSYGYTFRDVLHSSLFSGTFYMIRSRHRAEFDPRVLSDEQAA